VEIRQYFGKASAIQSGHFA